MPVRPRRYVFSVTGSGEFPHDMLRYDQCQPFKPEDRRVVEARYGENDEALWDADTKRLKMNTVRLVTEAEASDLVRSKLLPNHRRWESFTWKVSAEPIPVDLT